jgi:Zn-dependent M32 family carboxypeptidase
MQYEKKVDEVVKVVKEDFGTKGIKGAIDAATASTQELQGDTERLRTQAEIELEIYRRYVEDCASAWDSAKNATVGALEEAQEYLKKVGDIAIQTVTAIEAIAGAWKAAKGAKDDYGSTDPNPEGDGTIGFTLKNMQTGAFLNRDYEAAYQKMVVLIY